MRGILDRGKHTASSPSCSRVRWSEKRFRKLSQFRAAAENALAAGFDGVDIHAANGYLIDQFLRDGSNRRINEYGGPPENRLRLLGEISAAVVSAWGNGRVGIRLSPLASFNSMRDSYPEVTFCAAVELLHIFPLNYLHIVEQDDSLGSGTSFISTNCARFGRTRTW